MEAEKVCIQCNKADTREAAEFKDQMDKSDNETASREDTADPDATISHRQIANMKTRLVLKCQERVLPRFLHHEGQDECTYKLANPLPLLQVS